MNRTFTVSNKKIFTPTNLKGQTGSEWATHDVIGGKSRSQYIAPKLKGYTFDILLRAQDGARPRSDVRYFQRCAERGKKDYFVIGGTPLSEYPFRLVDVSDIWDAVLNDGTLIECKLSLTIEEYL
jgi:hypothetical protein